MGKLNITRLLAAFRAYFAKRAGVSRVESAPNVGSRTDSARTGLTAERFSGDSKPTFSALSGYPGAESMDGAVTADQATLAAERAAALARAELQLIADTVLTLVIRLDLDFRYVFVNRAYEQWFGRSLDDVVGKKVSDVVKPDLFTKIQPYLDRGVHGIADSFEIALRDGTGKTEHVLINCAPAHGIEGEIIGLVLTIQSIEKQKRAETEASRARLEVEASEARLRSIFAHAAVGFAVSESAGRFVEVNPRFCEITGYSESELKTVTPNLIIHPEDLARENALIEELLSGKMQHAVIEKRFIRKDGGTAWVRNSLSVLPGAAGERLVIRVAEEVTAEKMAEVARRESEAKFGLLANSMPQIVWTADASGQLDYFNQVWFDYSGTTHEENLGQGWLKAVHPDDIPKTILAWRASLETGARYENEFRLRSASGVYRWHVARATPAFDTNGKITTWYGTNTDIDDVKLLLEELTSARN